MQNFAEMARAYNAILNMSGNDMRCGINYKL